jgi:hypothetical protein
MKTFFAALTIDQLSSVNGGAFNGNTGITGGIKGINNRVPGMGCPPPFNGNTGITGGIPGINNHVPGAPVSRPGNTGITGGIPGINNKVPPMVFPHR